MNHRRAQLLRRLIGVAALVTGFATWVVPGAEAASSPPAPDFIGANADALRTSWFPDEAALPPSQINSRDFGEQFSQHLDGQVFAEPLISDGVLLAVTENDSAYGLNPTNGAIEWHTNYGKPQPSSSVEGGCGDISPTLGTTGTPVIDPTTDIAYFTTDIYTAGAPSIYLQAVHVANGTRVKGFPVLIHGYATDDSATKFDASVELQRPGLALVNGVVYAAFGSHCDLNQWLGWVIGVSTAGHITDMWSDEIHQSVDGNGGIWGSGGGLVVDNTGNLYFSTGNGTTPSPGPAVTNPQPDGLGNCVVRLSTANNKLQLADYFCPSNAVQLSANDEDLGSGAPAGLPASFGTAKTPDLLVAVGKEGYVYLLNRDDLGGMASLGHPDNVVQRIGPAGGVWSKPAVWPGDGGYIYIPTASAGQTNSPTSGELDIYQRFVDVNDNVSLSPIGNLPNFGFGSSSPIVTSDGMKSGSAIVWIVRIPPGAVNGKGGTLNAYAADPQAGAPGNGATLALLWQAPVGDATKFNPPLAAGGNVYIGTLDGDVLAFGIKKGAPDLAGNPLVAPSTYLGQSSETAVNLSATGTTRVENVTLQNGTTGASSAFSAGTPSPMLPVTLQAGETVSVPVTFRPEVLGGQVATLTVTTANGTVSLPVSGLGLSDAKGPIGTSPDHVNFGTLAIGSKPAIQKLTFTNNSSGPVTLSDILLPNGPFSLQGVERLPAPLAKGASTSLTVTFTPPRTSGDFPQVFTADVTAKTTAGNAVVPLLGTAAPPALMGVSTTSVSFGRVALGQSRIESFTVGDEGGLPLKITASKPPATAGFTATTALVPGLVIAPHTFVTEIVRFQPKATGAATASWRITSDDGTGAHEVALGGTGAKLPTVPPPGKSGWQLNGTAVMVGSTLQLTAAKAGESGSAFWFTAVPSDNLNVSFVEEIGHGSGADGMTLALADASKASPYNLGGDGQALGFGGIDGIAIALNTYPAGTNKSSNSVGVVTAKSTYGVLAWAVIDSSVPKLRPGPHTITVSVSGDLVSVSVDGTHAFNASVSMPPRVYVGFTGGTGALTDVHDALDVQIADPGAAARKGSRSHTTGATTATGVLPIGFPSASASAVASLRKPAGTGSAILAASWSAGRAEMVGLRASDRWRVAGFR